MMSPTSNEPLAPETLPEERSRARSPAHVGMVIFLGSWAMMFGALFFSYAVLRINMVIWPPPGFARLPLVLPGMGTLLLLASSRTLALALAALRCGQLARCRRELLLTIVLGAVFVMIQCKVWADLWKSGLHLDSGVHGGTFYVLTVFHGLHVLVGLSLLVRMVAPLARRAPVAPSLISAALTTMFWHFVAAVWLTMFVVVYVL